MDYIGTVASLIGSLTVVGSALMWLYNKYIGKPREKRRTREETMRHARMLEVVKLENEPLNHSIKQLNEWLNESKLDRKRLDELSKINKGRIDDLEKLVDSHDDRLIVLETTSNLNKKFQYQGGE